MRAPAWRRIAHSLEAAPMVAKIAAYWKAILFFGILTVFFFFGSVPEKQCAFAAGIMGVICLLASIREDRQIAALKKIQGIGIVTKGDDW